MSGCDGCTMCCKIMGVEELKKPRNEWCVHCNKGQGCSIYDERPQSCKDFKCGWLETQDKPGHEGMPLNLRPDRCHVILTMRTDGSDGLVFHVDPARPGAHTTGAAGALLTMLLRRGDEVIVACGEKRTLVGRRKLP